MAVVDTGFGEMSSGEGAAYRGDPARACLR